MFLGQRIDCTHLKHTRAIPSTFERIHDDFQPMIFESHLPMWRVFLISIVMEIYVYIIFVVVLKTCIVRVFKLPYIANIGNLIICPDFHSTCVKKMYKRIIDLTNIEAW